MTLPFSIPRPNMMDRLNFIGRTPRGETAQRYQFDDDEEDSDRRQLSPTVQGADVEAQHSRGAAPEMAERANHSSRFMLPGWSRPAIPSFLSTASSRRRQRHPRPSSSRYSVDDSPDPDAESPKSARFPRLLLNVPNLPSTRLNLPHLAAARTRTPPGSADGPPAMAAQRTDWTGRPLSPARTRFPVVVPEVVAVPEPVLPAVPAAHVPRTRGHDGRARLFSDPEEGQLAALAEDGRRRRRHRRGGSGGSSRDGGSAETGDGSTTRQRRHSGLERGPPPKHFLFCFPWIKSRRIRSQILRCFVSGLFLALLLAIYLALAITKNINSNEFTVLLILIIVGVTIFFCHGLVRLCMLIVRSGRGSGGAEEEEHEEGAASRTAMPEMFGRAGYAVPRRPIRVVLARDEEAAGVESVATKTNPPAYGLWRESVRVDPNRLYWMRNESASSSTTVDEEGRSSSGSGAGQRTDTGEEVPGVLRPPSYASDDGVSYVVEAQPRSIAPTTDVPLGPHPAEARRSSRPAAR